jgi:hypothetical protein
MQTWNTVVALLLAALVALHLPVKVLIPIFLAWIASAVFIVFFVWLDLDKVAGIFGSLAALAALYGIPLLMRERIVLYPAFRALVRADSSGPNAEVWFAIITCAIVLSATLLGVFVMNGAVQVFEIAEQVIDGGEPS